MAATDRRTFCVQSTHALFLAAVAASLDACSNPMGADSSIGNALPIFNGQVVNGTIAVPVASVPSLATVGGAVLIRTSSAQVLLSKTGTEAFTSVTAICTHEGCTVDRLSGSTYVCSCHGSEFTQAGAVVQGPANRALESKSNTFADGVVTIRV